MLDSGDNSGLHYLLSTLQMRIHIVRPGTLYFEYKVDAERGGDGLVVALNGFIQLQRYGVYDWSDFTIDLEVGYHTIEFQYYKNFSGEAGTDRAYLRRIEVTGTTFAQLDCIECPEGTIAECGCCQSSTKTHARHLRSWVQRIYLRAVSSWLIG